VKITLDQAFKFLMGGEKRYNLSMSKLILGGVLLLLSGLGSYLLLGNSVTTSTPGKLIGDYITKKEINEEKYNPPAIEQIFSEIRPKIVSSSLKPVITLIDTGDVIPARSVNYQSTIRKNFRWSFEKTADFLKSGDITFINLETPLIKNCPITQEGMIFCGSDKHIEGLVFAGVDIANLANNHAGNHGKAGINETVQLLNNNGILTTGINGPIFKEIEGVKFAFLGYNDIEKTSIVESANEEKMKQEISDADKKADVVIVQFHWGTEYLTEPEDRQKELARISIDSGADLIIGNHPHWIKPVEYYNGKLITYAHGNFVFDQEWSQKTKEGVVGKYTFLSKDLADVEYFPVEIKDYGQPYFLEGDKKQKILNEMKNESLKLISPAP